MSAKNSLTRNVRLRIKVGRSSRHVPGETMPIRISMWCLTLLFAVFTATGLPLEVAVAESTGPNSVSGPDFGPNVIVIDPSMSTSQIHAIVDPIANQQIPNQFGTQRYALLFKPGTYGTKTDPLTFQVGYYPIGG